MEGTHLHNLADFLEFFGNSFESGERGARTTLVFVELISGRRRVCLYSGLRVDRFVSAYMHVYSIKMNPRSFLRLL